MLHLVVILLVAGIALLFIEAFFAGADFGITGGLGIISLIASSVLMIITIPNGIFFALLMYLIVGAGIFIFIKRASKHGFLKKLTMEESLQSDTGGTVDLSNFAGKTGVATTPMRPIGTVDFGGVPVEAYSDGTYIDRGDKVIVTDSAENRLYVRRLQNGEKVPSEREKPSKPRAN